MAKIAGYLGEILLMTVVSGVLLLLAPDGNVKKHIRFLVSVCLVAAVSVPLLAAVRELPALIEAEEASLTVEEEAVKERQSTRVVEASKGQIEQAIASYLCARYGRTPDGVSVSVTLDASDLSAVEITSIRVALADGRDGEAIAADLRKLFLERSEIEVMVK